MAHHIHKVIYINLDNRTDRREQIESELSYLEFPKDKIERFPAVKWNPAYIGCTISHIQALRRARDEKWPNVLIMEDDFQLATHPDTFYGEIDRFFALNKEWDVLMFGYLICRSEDAGNDVVAYAREAQTGSAYLVHERFYSKLIACWEEGLHMLFETKQHWKYMNDQYWKKLQKDSEWFFFLKRLSRQRESHSDLSGQVASYDV